jgi:hypothetical protein
MSTESQYSLVSRGIPNFGKNDLISLFTFSIFSNILIGAYSRIDLRSRSGVRFKSLDFQRIDKIALQYLSLSLVQVSSIKKVFNRKTSLPFHLLKSFSLVVNNFG